MGPPHWSGDQNFDLMYHLRRVRVCEPTDDAVLDLARTAAMAGFDRSRPLWEYTLVDGLEDGRAAMVMKVHHSMTDGVGGMKLLLMLFDFEREPADPGPLDGVEADPDLHRRRPRAEVARPPAAPRDSAWRTASSPTRCRRARRLARHPRGSIAHAAEVGSSIAALPGAGDDAALARRCAPRTLARSLGTLDVPPRRPEARGQGGRRLAQRRVRGRRRRRPRAATTSSTASRSTTCAWSCRSTSGTRPPRSAATTSRPARFLVPAHASRTPPSA